MRSARSHGARRSHSVGVCHPARAAGGHAVRHRVTLSASARRSSSRPAQLHLRGCSQRDGAHQGRLAVVPTVPASLERRQRALVRSHRRLIGSCAPCAPPITDAAVAAQVPAAQYWRRCRYRPASSLLIAAEALPISRFRRRHWRASGWYPPEQSGERRAARTHSARRDRCSAALVRAVSHIQAPNSWLTTYYTERNPGGPSPGSLRRGNSRERSTPCCARTPPAARVLTEPQGELLVGMPHDSSID